MTAQPYDPTDPFGQPERHPSLSFRDAPIGTTYTGRVVEAPTLVRSRNYETGQPESWPDGNPKMTALVVLEVDGQARSLWAPKPSSMFAAIGEAQKAAGARIMPGGTLSVRLVGTEPNRNNPRLNPQKLYAAHYTPPAPGQGLDDPFGKAVGHNGTPAQQPQAQGWGAPAPAPQQQPQLQTVGAPAGGNWTPDPEQPPF